MIIKILSKQVPIFWEAIKSASVQADEVDRKNYQAYLNELLHALLSDKAQCFIRLSEERILLFILITRFQIDKVTGNKNLFVQSLYSWKKIDEETLQDAGNLVKNFAKREGCSHLFFESRHERVWQFAESLGFRECLRRFIFDL